ncbi:MAG: fumarylacetoacetate hydrolase family protein [Chloroflexota bacterium]|nr:fumarylacetoacetate hydrolase family protein [Chloroflexota bacterium]
MRFARYYAHGEVAYGVVEDGMVKQITTTPFEDYQVTDHTHPLDHVQLLAPVVPGKVVAIALNYSTHLGERPAPKRVEGFYKPHNCIIADGENIVLPADAGRVDEEGELVVIIGKTAKNVSKADALDFVMGYTIGNDVSARDWQNGPEKDMQWWRAKGADTFGPLGPFISTDIDPFDFTIQVTVNGEKTENVAHSRDLIFDIPTVIAEISRYVTLDPGDIIYSGTPGRTSQLQPGDVVEVEIPGIGVLRNSVVSE